MPRNFWARPRKRVSRRACFNEAAADAAEFFYDDAALLRTCPSFNEAAADAAEFWRTLS